MQRKKATIAAFLFFMSVPAFGRQRISGFCEQGGITLSVSGLGAISQKVQGSYPGCTVTIYLTGTITLATTYADNTGTPKANPSASDSTTGYWFYYVDDGRYDVKFSNSGITTYTLGDVLAADIHQNILFASSYSSGSSTGGIQEAIDAVSGNGEVWVTESVSASAEIDMVASVNVRGIGQNVSVTFTGATNGFVWPASASRSKLYNINMVCGNAACGKAVDIEDASSAASNVVVEDVGFTSNNAPTNRWTYGVYLSNAIDERFSRLFLQSALTPIHSDGITNATEFSSINLTSNINGTTYVDLQGGAPIIFNGGTIEGNASSELVKITQPGAAGSYIRFIGTVLENANASGAGIRANGGRFDCDSCDISLSNGKAFVIGDSLTTRYCNIIGGRGGPWTFGANASDNVVLGYAYASPPDPTDNSGGMNFVLASARSGDATYFPLQSMVLGGGGLKILQQNTSAGSFQFKQAAGNTNDPLQFLDSSDAVKVNLDSNFNWKIPSASSYKFINNAGSGSVLGISKDSSDVVILGDTAGTKTSKLNVTATTGTAPFTIASVTPVVNLTASQTAYYVNETQYTNSHMVVDKCTLGTNCNVTLTGPNVYSSGASYQCTANDLTTANPVRVNIVSASSVTFTGTGTDQVAFICFGN